MQIVSQGGGGGTPPAWKDLDTVHDATLVNASTPVTSSFTFDQSFWTGDFQFSATWANTTNQADGYGTEPDYFDIPLESIHPGYSPSTHLLEVQIEFLLRGTSGNDSTVLVALVDNGGTKNGVGIGFCDFAVGDFRIIRVQRSSSIATGTLVNPTYKFRAAFFGPSDEKVIAVGSYENTGGDWVYSVEQASDTMTGGPWFLRIGALKLGASNANGDQAEWTVSIKVSPRE